MVWWIVSALHAGIQEKNPNALVKLRDVHDMIRHDVNWISHCVYIFTNFLYSFSSSNFLKEGRSLVGEGGILVHELRSRLWIRTYMLALMRYSKSAVNENQTSTISNINVPIIPLHYILHPKKH